MLKAKIPCPETGIEIKKSICAICDPMRQCGLSLYVKNGTIIKVDGNEQHPFNQGKLCSKGASTRQYVYAANRLTTPLKRIGPRGSGQFERISWDEAMTTITDRLLAIKREHGPETVSFFAGYSKYFRPYLKRLTLLFGSPNYFTESSTCHQAIPLSQRLVFGTPSAAPDIRNTECLVVWSANPFYTHFVNARGLLANLDRGMKMIVVDPRKTPTSDRATLHLRIRPGTDGALALAMANTIISENLYDIDFVTNYTYGFEEYKAYVSNFTPEKGEELTGVPAEQIIAAARMIGNAKSACILPSGSAIVHHTNGVQNNRAIFALIGLTGNFARKGGQVIFPDSFIHVPGRIHTNEASFMQPVPWNSLPPRVGSDRFPVWTEMIDEEAQALQIVDQQKTGQPYPLKSIVGFGLNYRMFPDSEGFLAALKKMDFFVNIDLFMTDTCKNADIVLPACTSVERSEMRCYPMGYIILTQPAINPLYESRADVDIIIDLANRLGLDDPLFKGGYEACLDYVLSPAGFTAQELKQHPDGMWVPNPYDVPFESYKEDGFETPSGKLEFKSTVLEKYDGRPGFEALPIYTPPKYSAERSPELAKSYPLILNTGPRPPMFVHTRMNEIPWIKSLRPNHPTCDINPLDATKLGIKSGDRVKVSTPKDFIVVTANLSEMVLPGVVNVYHGCAQADVNRLFEGDYVDPLSGYPGYKSALCRVDKYQERAATTDE